MAGSTNTNYQVLLQGSYSPLYYWPLEDTSVALNQVEQLGSATGLLVGGSQTVGVTTRVPGPMADKTNYACRFAGGSASFIDLDSNVSLPGSLLTSQTGTLILWYNGNGVSGYAWACVNTSALSGHFNAMGNGGVVQWSERRSVGATNQALLTSTGTFPDAVWHMYAVVSAGSGQNVVYVDGVAVAVTPSTSGTGTTADWFGDMDQGASDYFPTVGARRIVVNSGSSPFKGDVAQISIHNAALSAADIAALYLAATSSYVTRYRHRRKTRLTA
jgi:hypothetical protein